METTRFDVVFETDGLDYDEFLERFKALLKDYNGSLKLYELENLKDYRVLLGF